MDLALTIAGGLPELPADEAEDKHSRGSQTAFHDREAPEVLFFVASCAALSHRRGLGSRIILNKRILPFFTWYQAHPKMLAPDYRQVIQKADVAIPSEVSHY